MDIRRILIVKDIVLAEGGLPAIRPVTRVAACAGAGDLDDRPYGTDE